MPFIRNLWVATLSHAGEDSGTESETVFIMNKGGLDVVHRDMRLFREVAEGGGSFTIMEVSDPDSPRGLLPARRHTRRRRLAAGRYRGLVPAVHQRKHRPSRIHRRGRHDPRRQLLGRTDLVAPSSCGPRRHQERDQPSLLMTITHFLKSATDSAINVRITRGDEVVVDHTIVDTPQSDFESGQANLYFLPALAPFTRSQLTDSSIELSIKGDDAWRPITVIMFGLDRPSGNPGRIVPLVHLHPWKLGWLSTDLDEGVPSVPLPLAPIDP